MKFSRFVLGTLIYLLSAFAIAQVDFTALERGRRAAEEDQRRAAEAQRQAERHFIETQERRRANAPTYEEQADYYLEPILGLREQSLANGSSPEQFWNDARTTILRDPNFQRMPVDLKRIILRKIGELKEMIDG